MAKKNNPETGSAAIFPAEARRWRGPEQLAPFLVAVDDLHEDPANTNGHDDESIARIAASFARFGQQKPFVSDKHGVVRAGNGGLRAICGRLGWSHVAVVRSDLIGSELAAYAIADNRTAEFARRDQERLLAQLQAIASEEDSPVAATGYTEAEIDALLAEAARSRLGHPGTNGDGSGGGWSGDRDDVPDPTGGDLAKAGELQAKWGTYAGQLWAVPSLAMPHRDHRLICGDCRDQATIDRLLDGARPMVVVTSPPYASQRKYDEASGFKPIRPDDYGDWFAPVQAMLARVLAPGGSYFLNIKEHTEDGQRHLYVKDLTIAHVRRWGWRFVDEFCWRDTGNGFMGRWHDRFKNAWEPVFHFCRDESIKFNPLANGTPSDCIPIYSWETDISLKPGGAKQGEPEEHREGLARPSNVIECNSASYKFQGAGFPVPIPEFFLRAFSDPSDPALDPFLGSGTTLVACEQQGRVGYGVELSPLYLAVALERLATMGLSPRLT